MKPFGGTYPGTAESYLLHHLKFREKVGIGLLLLIAVCGCSHETVVPTPAQTAAHDAAGCLQVCPQATYVELSPKGDLCRCWAPSAFTFTFLYPDDPAILQESRARWVAGKKAAEACMAKGQAWEPSADRKSIVCMQPSEPPPGVPLRHTSLSGRNKPTPKWLRLTPWESWRPRIWKRSA